MKIEFRHRGMSLTQILADDEHQGVFNRTTKLGEFLRQAIIAKAALSEGVTVCDEDGHVIVGAVDQLHIPDEEDD
jgi:hypothetical protein